MRRTAYLTALVVVAVCASMAAGQEKGEDLIKKALEGRQVLVKMDLPAVDSGLTFTFDDANVSYDEPGYKALVREYGTALAKDTRATITRVRVTRRGVEIDLNGGGSPSRDVYGGNFHVDAPVLVAKSTREQELERQIPLETNSATLSAMRSDLELEQRLRLTQDAKNQESYQQMLDMHSKYLEANRKGWGTKIIVLVRSRKPSVKMKDLVQSLAKYVELLPRETPPSSGT
jgi:hypothetical protein